MYQWIVYLHLIGVFGFLLAHGVSAAVAFRLRREQNRDHIRLLLELSNSSLVVMGIAFLVLLVSGIIGGFMGQWWSRLWIWLALGLLIAITVIMSVFAQRYYHRLRQVIDTASDAEIAAIAASGRPLLLSVIGFGGIIVITWLMEFKPF